jgi:class 3 adenylate cyclase
VLDRYLRRCMTALHDLAERLARETEEPEVELFPRILTAMRDSLLVFAEDRIGPDLRELDHYARGHVGVDPDDFRRRFEELVVWERRLRRDDPDFEAAVSGLVDRHGERGRFFERGYLSYLASLSSYPSDSLFSPREVAAWEGLVLRLKEFELFDGLRHLIVRLRPDGDRYRCDPRDAERIGAPKQELFTRTRPVDFMAPWLVDPEVSRGGLIYDISKFTATVSRLGKNEHSLQDRAFRALVRFQRRFDHLAHSLGLRFEKYLGDGAFYSGVELESLLVSVVLMQRHYRRSVESGFPFKEGMRIALNYGDYRLMPFGDRRKGDARYEAFGHGVVELSRLVSGKPGPTLEEIRAELVRLGYEDWLVRNFLAPMERRRGLGNPTAPRRRRPFRAFIEHDGTLANEGIVATEHFLRELSKSWQPTRARRGALDGALCVLVELEHRDHAISIALRKLGSPNLKGIEDLTVFEVIDRDAHNVHDLGACPEAPLMELLEDAYNASPTRMM